MEVDWNGTTMELSCEATGEVATAHLFVACLPYSQYSYVEATLDMKQNTWLMCHVHAWEFFGGVAVRTVCDNMKCEASHFMLSQTVRTATPPKNSQAWTWHMSHVFCFMSSVAST